MQNFGAVSLTTRSHNHRCYSLDVGLVRSGQNISLLGIIIALNLLKVEMYTVINAIKGITNPKRKIFSKNFFYVTLQIFQSYRSNFSIFEFWKKLRLVLEFPFFQFFTKKNPIFWWKSVITSKLKWNSKKRSSSL